VTSNGLSNPLSFLVDARPEVTKPDSKSIPEARGSLNARIDARPLPRNVVLPSILNGQIPPGCVDRYSFAAKTGQKLVVLVQARQLIPYIADAAPGWFQATVTLSDAAGTSLAANDDFDDRGSGLKTHDADSANAQGASLVGGFLAGKPISARARVHAVASPLQCHGARLRQLVEPRGRGRGPGAAPPLRLGHREHRSGGRERVPGRTRRLDRPVDDLPRRPAFRDRTRGCETR
jgi:hypothetical protein